MILSFVFLYIFTKHNIIRCMDEAMKQSGFLLIDKPKGWTSFDIVAKLRSICKIKKIGHAGTLDPMATGLLIVAIGREATKRIDEFKAQEKVYEAEIEFGMVSDTYDTEGKVERLELSVDRLERGVIEKGLKSFIGEIEQMPPAFSAKKIKGVPAYKLARQGKEVDLKPSIFDIKTIEILNFDWPKLELEITCGPGTYIRSLAHDLGQDLQVGAILTVLKRTRIGNFDLSQAVKLEQLTIDNWQSFVLKI